MKNKIEVFDKKSANSINQFEIGQMFRYKNGEGVYMKTDSLNKNNAIYLTTGLLFLINDNAELDPVYKITIERT